MIYDVRLIHRMPIIIKTDRGKMDQAKIYWTTYRIVYMEWMARMRYNLIETVVKWRGHIHLLNIYH